MKGKISGPIILVDDDDDDHELYRMVCTQLHVCDYFKHFHSGDELIEYLETTVEKPFIIFCDINMPGMDGLRVREIINQSEKLRNKSIPFIFLSTAATPDQVRRAYDLTVQGFFVKGNTLQETVNKFRHVLEYWMDCKHPNSL
jgi:CheY-like chemotaxis protein